MNTRMPRLLTTVISCGILGISAFAVGCNETPVTPEKSDVSNGVYVRDSKPFGKTYTEWSIAWWKWVTTEPVFDANQNLIHPLFDTTGARAASGQQASSAVYFLAGSFAPGTITRTITISENKALFFPILNAYADTTGNWTIDSMTQAMDRFISSAKDLVVHVDGQLIPNPADYRFRTNEFTTTVTDKSMYTLQSIAPGTVIPLISDGYWIMLAPLSKGTHSVHFKGTVDNPARPFALDITYNITVQ